MAKTVLITGATAGIGAAAARRFARDGWKVVGTGRRQERLDALADELGDSFHALNLDIRDLDAIPAAVESLPEGFGTIDVLINNAGLAPPMQPLQEADLGASLNSIQTNINGLVAITRHLLPGLIERKGAVINL